MSDERHNNATDLVTDGSEQEELEEVEECLFGFKSLEDYSNFKGWLINEYNTYIGSRATPNYNLLVK